jgi:hypothetical protein
LSVRARRPAAKRQKRSAKAVGKQKTVTIKIDEDSDSTPQDAPCEDSTVAESSALEDPTKFSPLKVEGSAGESDSDLEHGMYVAARVFHH